MYKLGVIEFDFLENSAYSLITQVYMSMNLDEGVEILLEGEETAPGGRETALPGRETALLGIGTALGGTKTALGGRETALGGTERIELNQENLRQEILIATMIIQVNK